MAGEERDRDFEAFVAGRAPALLRTAYLVTGDGPAAERLLGEALAETYLAWNRIDDREGVEVYVRRVMLTAHASSTGVSVAAPPERVPRDLQGRIWAALGELGPRERAVLVLASRDQLDDEEIARVLTCSRRSVQTDGQHAAILVREALSRRVDPAESDDPDGGHADEAKPQTPRQETPESPETMAGLEVAIRATLAAHADDVRPPLALADDARDRAEQLRRRRRSRGWKGAAVLVGLVAVVAVAVGLVDGRSSGSTALPTVSPQHSEPPFSSFSSGPEPPSSPSGSGAPAPEASVVAVPDSVLRLARENDALVAFGSAIVDSSNGSAVVSIDTDPSTGASVGGAILALARSAGGYVVLTSGDDVADTKPLTISYVRTDGTRVELGRVDTQTSGFAVAADGLSVVHVVKGPVDGENAVAAGNSELVVQDLAADVENRVTVAGDVLPVSLTGQTVVFRRLDLPVNDSYSWDRASGTVTRVDVPTNQVPVETHDTRILLRTGTGSSCVLLSQALSPETVDTVWRRCGVFGTAGFDPTGSEVAVVLAPESKAELVVLNARDGSRAFSRPLEPGFPFQLEWTNGQKVLMATVGAEGQVTYTAVSRSGAGAGVVTSATYEVPDGPVVLGRELPLPAAG